MYVCDTTAVLDRPRIWCAWRLSEETPPPSLSLAPLAQLPAQLLHLALERLVTLRLMLALHHADAKHVVSSYCAPMHMMSLTDAVLRRVQDS
jgi:hypothetical protein